MFCKIKKTRNLIAVFILLSIGFLCFQVNKEYVLKNESGSLSTKITKPIMIIFSEIKKNSLPSEQNIVAMYMLSQAHALFGKDVKIAMVLNVDSDSDESQILYLLNLMQKRYKFNFGFEVYLDKNNKFAKKFRIRQKPTVVLMKNNKVQYKTQDFKFQWFGVDGIKLINEYLGIAVGL
ncbi:hypothetical protein [Candidatus Cytomitobacter primus]|uniref:Uncharacterized protein n=1 Tax=Candidatus Cytomitobacter primus TaxID=2066024 RepID=A0A5C0UES2_9PROT|nr:hypothetical protein [Candidatus Cytomitobacter primus]QEK38595.1 hypothetical protein FZC34_01570 [Candidatus Cytomitobacter primus]